MKCPKCSYLGFDTSERCRNCGYDFSLMAVEEPAAGLSLRLDTDEGTTAEWRESFDAALATPPGSASAVATASPSAPASAAAMPRTIVPSALALDADAPLPPTSFRGSPSLPLFGSSATGEDEPLVKVPAQPRPPLSVRRTPETPRLRSVSRPVERPVPAPALNFTDESVTPAAVVAAPAPPAARTSRPGPQGGVASPAVPRLIAALIDQGILLTIDAVVLYLTLRIASLTLAEWTALPMLPMIAFLGLLKLSYFTAFTCVGGQTIGKMAAGIRVVGEDLRPIDAAHAVHRALAGALSLITLGAGFIPALLGADRRALHDRLARTRVITVPVG